jgi:protein involved in polysaccharide export with SLBB domain
MNNKNYNEYKKNRKILDILTLSGTITYNKSQDISVAIIVPHRKRIDHLKKFIGWLDKLKKSPNHTYDIYVIDQKKFTTG